MKYYNNVIVGFLLMAAIFQFSCSGSKNDFIEVGFHEFNFNSLFKLISDKQKLEEYYLGSNEAIRTYIEFADGSHRGMYDPETDSGGYADEDYDATTAMVINWHSLPEQNPKDNSRLEYRQEFSFTTNWQVAEGES